jgi:hypothetical protein
MNRLVIAALSAASAGALLIASSPPAQAVAGDVVVFSTESQRLETYRNPEGCNKLPPAAHVLVNLSSSDLVIYGDPFCMTPGLTVDAGYGSHVPAGSGSFLIRR